METETTAASRIEQLLDEISYKADHLQASDWETFGTHGSQQSDASVEEEWKRVRVLADREWDEFQLQKLKRHYQNRIRTCLIETWISSNTSLGGSEADSVKEMIKMYLREDRREELEVYLTDVLAQGVKAADKRLRRRNRGNGGWLLYTWTVIVGVLYVGAAFAVMSIGESRFQQAALVVLVMIYNLLASRGTDEGFVRLSANVREEKRSDQVRRALGIHEEKWEREMRTEEKKELDVKGSRAVIALYIHSGFQTIVWLLSLWKLSSAVL